jgi:hypothetical protein
VEGGGGVTLRVEYFAGGGSEKRFAQEEKTRYVCEKTDI